MFAAGEHIGRGEPGRAGAENGCSDAPPLCRAGIVAPNPDAELVGNRRRRFDNFLARRTPQNSAGSLRLLNFTHS
jgi:hypothetical protein